MSYISELTGLGPVLSFIIALAITVVIGLLVIYCVIKILRKVLRKSDGMDEAMSVFIVNFVKVGCIIILIAIVLQMCGVSMSTIVAVLGAAGAAIALALRDSLANIAGGFMILITRPFGEGDLVSVGQDRGYVEKIDLFLTTLRTFDRRTITIPNGVINTSVIYNESNRDIRRVDCVFSIGYGADIDRAKAVLRRVCQEGTLILDDPEPIIGVRDHEDSAITLDLFAYCKTADIWNARYYLEEAVKKAFDEEGIEIPYQHVEVHVKE